MHNILVSAYGCEPFVGSEAGVGWNWVLQMAKNNRLHVITRENNREKIEINLPVNLRKNIGECQSGGTIKCLPERHCHIF